MSAVRRMKYEMTLAERKRRRSGPPTLEQMLQEADITDADRDEVRRFADYLKDVHGGMSTLESIDKYGAAYLGYLPEEVAALASSVDRSSTGGATARNQDAESGSGKGAQE